MLNLLLLTIAISFEVCGDAAIRIGLRGGKPAAFLCGAILVICYGTVISFPKWSFSRTMGVYIALFFIISQVISRVMLREHVKLPTIVGGVLIISGGLIILLWKPT
jgi:small multidrug resistance family-3 protein